MATPSEMASGIAKQATSIGMEAATLALRLADAECKTNPAPINSTAQADWEDQHRGTQPTPVDGNLVERAQSAYTCSNGDGQKKMEAAGRVFQQDSNARWEKAIRKGLSDRKEQYVDSVLFDIRFHAEAGSLPPTLQERITERFKTQKIINSCTYNPAELAAIAVEEAKKEQK